MSLYQSRDEVRSGMVGSLHLWSDGHARGRFSDCADFEPIAFKNLLPYLLISDIEYTPFRVRYRLVGTRVVAATGYDITGHYLDELDTANEEEAWLDDYALSYQTRSAVVGLTTFLTRTGLRFSYNSASFQWTNGGDRIAQFIAIEDYFEFGHLFGELPEWGRAKKRKPRSASR